MKRARPFRKKRRGRKNWLQVQIQVRIGPADLIALAWLLGLLG